MNKVVKEKEYIFETDIYYESDINKINEHMKNNSGDYENIEEYSYE